WMRARTLRGEERSFEVRAKDARTRAARGQRSHRLDRCRLVGGDEGRLVGGDSREQHRFARAPVVLGRRGEEIDAAITVDLDVDQARNRDQSAASVTQADRDNAPVIDLDVTGDELAADERGLDPEPHVDAALRTDQGGSVLSSRALAESASMSARSDT